MKEFFRRREKAAKKDESNYSPKDNPHLQDTLMESEELIKKHLNEAEKAKIIKKPENT